MTVADLIHLLKLHPPEREVWVQGLYEQAWPGVSIEPRGKTGIVLKGKPERDWS